MNETSANFWQRLNGQIGTGFTYSKGNNSAPYNLNSDINYPRERWSAGVGYNSNFTSNTGANTSTRNEVAFSAQRLMRWNNWNYMGLADFLQSSVQGIQMQVHFGRTPSVALLAALLPFFCALHQQQQATQSPPGGARHVS
jgi:hypothetical protein